MAKQYDLVVIGAGPGGYTAAIQAADFGMKVAVVEEKELGGVCVNRGCIPTKALLYASHIFSLMQTSDEFGIFTDQISFDYGKMQKYKDKSVITYREEIQRMFEEKKIDFIQGKGILRRDRTVEVHGSDGKEYCQGTYVLLATGAKAAVPDIPGADLPGVVISDKILNGKDWNYNRIVIIGGGVIGVEMATIFNNLCSQVTIVERNDHLLGPMDHQVALELEEDLKRKGINIYCSASQISIAKEESLVCTFQSRKNQEISQKAGIVLIATGRKPDVSDLFGEDVQPEMKDGRLVVDGAFQTSEKGVYAIGDLVANIQLAHVAAAQGTYVVENLLKKEHSIKLEVVPNGMFVSLPIVPSCIYTTPEIATVGITEETAKAYGMKVRVGHYSMNENGKSIITRADGGFIRLVFEAYSNTIVGAQMICPRATDMIGEMATAIANGLTAVQLSQAMRAHPTYSEGIKYAIEDAMKED
ncbi:MAG: dihydrolipoyl dehydrogenase [Lachnospiraceae bacterium]|jgi:dihydrolipoamide dehydrogenase|nr:dihydrolipoyl dehydrogenase [Lachnospiraceae bacterium]